MAAPVIIGEPRSILSLGPARMKQPKSWTLSDSDTVAHFLQVHQQIAKSQWAHAKVSFTRTSTTLLDAEFPKFDDFVYAAVYFRQLVVKKDRLLDDAADRYLKHADSAAHIAWISYERSAFRATLNGRCFPMLQSYKVHELFDAFLYGAGLVHKFPRGHDAARARFLRLHDTEPREVVLFALHSSLHKMLNHTGNVAVILHRDFAHWMHQHELPRPDVRWHDRLFEIR